MSNRLEPAFSNHASAQDALLEDISAWKIAVSRLPGVTRIGKENQRLFSELLSSENDADSYLTSSAYYAFTGRNGLWVYQEGASFIPFCWHPNVPGEILVFPARGSYSASILHNFLQTIPEPPCGLRLARVKGGSFVMEETSPMATKLGQSVVFAPVIEHVLDWKYPVRVLSTDLVSKMEGPNFRHVRNHIRQILLKNPEIRNLRDVPSTLLDRFIVEWAGNAATTVYEISDLVNLYRTIMSLSDDPALNVEGLVVLINGRVEALNMWDVSNPNNPTANRFVNLCNTAYSGLADFVMNRTAKCLFAQGIKYLNIGGAETESLDRFKRKFMPAYSIGLHSVEVEFQSFNDMNGAAYNLDRSAVECSN
ncbi:MAG: hypothetical protein WC521_02250 [Bdellovibrionales bacterium]